MSRKFIAAVLALSMTVTGFSATPSAADNNDVARAIVAGTALAIIGSAIANADSDNNHHRPRTSVHMPRPYHSQSLPRVVGRAHQAPVPRVTRRAILPRSCLREVKGGNMRYVLGKGCLERNGWRASSLPGKCRIQVRSQGDTRSAYVAGCLRDAGYGIEGFGGQSGWRGYSNRR